MNFPNLFVLVKVLIINRSVAFPYEKAWFLRAASFSQKDTNCPTLLGVVFATLNRTDFEFN